MGLFSKNTPATKPQVPPPPPDPRDGSDIMAPPSAFNPSAAGAPAAPATPKLVHNAPKPTPLVDSKPPPLGERQVQLQQLRVKIHQQLVERLDVQNLRSLPPETVRSEVRVLIRELTQSEKG